MCCGFLLLSLVLSGVLFSVLFAMDSDPDSLISTFFQAVVLAMILAYAFVRAVPYIDRGWRESGIRKALRAFFYFLFPR